MPTPAHLTPAQLGEFAERGYLLLPGAVAPDLVDAANEAVDTALRHRPPPAATRGPHNHHARTAAAPHLAALVTASGALARAEELTGPATLDVPAQVQVALNIPPHPHRPGMHHLDGATPPEPDGRPGTFTLLAGVLLTDQTRPDSGNLWVWPGTHHTHARYFRDHGPDAFLAAAGYPPIALPEPEQILGRRGDLLLAHFLLGHNIGGNTSPDIRRAAYFRIKRRGHDPHWRAFLQDPWHDYDAVRAHLEAS